MFLTINELSIQYKIIILDITTLLVRSLRQLPYIAYIINEHLKAPYFNDLKTFGIMLFVTFHKCVAARYSPHRLYDNSSNTTATHLRGARTHSTTETHA